MKGYKVPKLVFTDDTTVVENVAGRLRGGRVRKDPARRRNPLARFGG